MNNIRVPRAETSSHTFLENTARPDPFGIPAAFLFMLLKQRSAINPPIDKSLEKEKGKQYVVVSERWFGKGSTFATNRFPQMGLLSGGRGHSHAIGSMLVFYTAVTFGGLISRGRVYRE